MRLVQKMLAGMQKGMEEGMHEVLDELAKRTLDAAQLAEALKMMGIDMPQTLGTMGQVPGFDPYRILGLEKSASDEEVRKRYHELVRKLHPDTAGTKGTTFLLQLVLAAYEAIRRERQWDQH